VNYEDPKALDRLMADLRILQEEQDEKYGDGVSRTAEQAVQAIEHLRLALSCCQFNKHNTNNKENKK
jgi:hypothetical protein